ncbi:MAG: hypothetical protein MZV63_12950 [Marinilabiliales bacterium]|nr:hypothetical protein [Marinilabiliales bacterium]
MAVFRQCPDIAWKTGTSFGYRDAWAVGTTPEYVVAVWAGNADGEGRPGLSGISSAAPLLFDIFRLLQTSARRIHADLRRGSPSPGCAPPAVSGPDPIVKKYDRNGSRRQG